MSSPAVRRDFFISFNSADRAWAEWIASELEAAGYTTFFQHWDFLPGSNFVLEMHKAATLSDRTIAVLSPDYLEALFTQPEWAAALLQDPTGSQRTLVPIRVHPCKPEGLLKPIVYADVVSLNEEEARTKLLAAVSGGRAKPTGATPFPAHSSRKRFPGAGSKPPAKPPVIPGRTNATTPDHPNQLLTYAAISLICFLLGLGLLFLMLWKVETLATFGLTGKLFYVVLIPMGLAAAGFLFGVLRSMAIFRGKQFGGAIELGGPIVAFAMVIGGGFYLPPPEPGTFSMTVFVHGSQGPQEHLLRGKGKVVMDLHGSRRPESIDEKGAAYFPGIPSDLRGQDVSISLDADGFERTDAGQRKLTGEIIYLPVRKSAGRLYGVVVDQQREPVAGASVTVDSVARKTDASGRFDMIIPGSLMGRDLNMHVHAPGFESWSDPVVPNSNEINISLKERRK